MNWAIVLRNNAENGHCSLFFLAIVHFPLFNLALYSARMFLGTSNKQLTNNTMQSHVVLRGDHGASERRGGLRCLAGFPAETKYYRYTIYMRGLRIFVTPAGPPQPPGPVTASPFRFC